MAQEAIVATGLSHVVQGSGGPEDACDPTPFLKEKKSRKYLGVQDALAIVTAGRALAEAGLGATPPPERTGLYIAVGYIPFLEKDILPVISGSLDPSGAFSLERFAAEGYQRAHPLLAFRCLPNMPAYHIASCFGVEGPYLVCYPSAGELYLALSEAIAALDERRIDVAIVTGVAHQRNYLVEHQMARVDAPPGSAALRDAAATVILERADAALARGQKPLATLASISIDYVPFDPLTVSPPRVESVTVDGGAPRREPLELGPAAPLIGVALALAGGASRVEHAAQGRDGIACRGAWTRGMP